MGGCQNYGLLLGPLNTRGCTVLRTQNRTIILTTTHMSGTVGPTDMDPAYRTLAGGLTYS